jgi:hypothetical protein
MIKQKTKAYPKLHIRQLETTNCNNYRSGKQFQNENYLVIDVRENSHHMSEPIDLVAGHIQGQSTSLYYQLKSKWAVLSAAESKQKISRNF